MHGNNPIFFLGSIAVACGCSYGVARGSNYQSAEQVLIATESPRTAIDWEWLAVDPMPDTRIYHFAAQTKDGRVIVVGGIDPEEGRRGYREWSTVHLYDPTSNEWETGADFPLPAPNLRVWNVDLYDGTGGSLIAGVVWANPDRPGIWSYPAALLYRYEEGKWTEIEVSDAALEAFGTTPSFPLIAFLTPERILAVGGLYSSGGRNLQVLSTVFEYDFQTDEWRTRASLRHRRDQAAGGMLFDGRLLVTAGLMIDVVDGFPDPIEIHEPLVSSEIYDPESNTWSDAPNIPNEHRFGTTLTLQDGSVLVIGGAGSTEVDRYDPVHDAWHNVGTASSLGFELSVVQAVSGEVLIAAGGDNAWMDVFHPTTETWSQLDLPDGMGSSETITEIGGDRYLVTGSGPTSAAILQLPASELTVYVPFSLRRVR